MYQYLIKNKNITKYATLFAFISIFFILLTVAFKNDEKVNTKEKDINFVNADLNSIKKVLVEFSEDKQKIGKYFNEFQRLRKYLISGMNEVNELKLSQFK